MSMSAVNALPKKGGARLGAGRKLPKIDQCRAVKLLGEGLTDDEMESTFLECGGKWNGDYWKIEDADFHPFLRTIEAKLKEKNSV